MRPAEERDVLTMEGIVESVSRGDIYRCECQIGSMHRTVLARRCGKMIQANVRVIAGDRVTVEVSPYDLARGRIIYRYK
jgi:translation initiation factor IF-1